MPAKLISTVVRVTSRYPAVHGALVHIGAPEQRGLDDLGAPDFGDPVEIRAGEVSVFWDAGYVAGGRHAFQTPLVLAHTPGHMAINDAWGNELQVL